VSGEKKISYSAGGSGEAGELREAPGRRTPLADEQPSPEQIAIYRSMTGQRRLEIADQLFWTARALKVAGVRYQHPDWTEEKVLDEVNRIFLHAAD
jgi:hypothetical protein